MIHIGGRAGEYGGFEGKIDQLRVYNRILSMEEVMTLYREGG